MAKIKFNTDTEYFDFESKYKFNKVMKDKIKHHFEQGLLLNSLSGKLGISKSTLERWRKGHDEFEAYLSVCYPLAELKTDEEHVAASFGSNKDANAGLLNRRASHILEMVEKTEVTNTHDVSNKILESLGEINPYDADE